MPSTTYRKLVPIALAALALAACGKKPAEEPLAAEDPAAQQATQEAAAIQARQEELARREAELALREKEKELADREALLAKANAPKPAPKKVAAAPAPAPAPKPAAEKPKPVDTGPKNYVVPTGTSLSVQLPAEISTKTAKVGQRLTGNLTNDIVIDGKTVARAGTPVQGSITQVISGSKTIGGKPTLGITFDSMTFEGGDMPIAAKITQIADKSDKAGDTAKIAGGAVAGGVIGHQVDSDKGKVIGALIGAAAGTAAAKKTGKEVVLPAGTVVGMTLESPVTVTM